jgi:hypothetical protein
VKGIERNSERNRKEMYYMASEGWKSVIQTVFNSNNCVLNTKPFNKTYNLETGKRRLTSKSYGHEM